jgi:hypothetical protein
MIINLCAPRRIPYRINQTDHIDSIEYIISFPSGYIHRFDVHLDKDTGEIVIDLPILKDIIKDEFDGIGYILIKQSNGEQLDVCKETVRFVSATTINIIPDNNNDINLNKNLEPINSIALRTNEVLVSHSNTLKFIRSNSDRNQK